MAKYIRFTVTPTDGSPYTQWLNTDVVYRSFFYRLSDGASYSIGGDSSNLCNVFAVPTSTSAALDVLTSAEAWWSEALDKLESQTSQVMFIDADGSPACGIAGLSATQPATPAPPPPTKPPLTKG